MDCEESIKIGKITLKLVRKDYPELASRIVDVLKKPVIYWNYFEWIILNGHMQKEKINYTGTLNYESLIDGKIKSIIVNGDNLKIEKDNISVLKNRKDIGCIERKNGIPLCINFK